MMRNILHNRLQGEDFSNLILPGSRLLSTPWNLNPQENVWQFLHDNRLSNRMFKSYDDIVDHCCDAWNSLVEQPWGIMSMGLTSPFAAGCTVFDFLRSRKRYAFSHRRYNRRALLLRTAVPKAVYSSAEVDEKFDTVFVRKGNRYRAEARDVLILDFAVDAAVCTRLANPFTNKAS